MLRMPEKLCSPVSFTDPFALPVPEDGISATVTAPTAVRALLTKKTTGAAPSTRTRLA